MIPGNNGNMSVVSDVNLIAEGRSTFNVTKSVNKQSMTLGQTQNTLLAKSQKGISGVASASMTKGEFEDHMPKIKIKMMLNSDKSSYEEGNRVETSEPENKRTHTLPMASVINQVRETEAEQRVQTQGSHIVVTEGNNEPLFNADGSPKVAEKEEAPRQSIDRRSIS